LQAVLTNMWEMYFKEDQEIGSAAILNLIQVFGDPARATIEHADDVISLLTGDPQAEIDRGVFVGGWSVLSKLFGR
jgi:hypothetical protein